MSPTAAAPGLGSRDSVVAASPAFCTGVFRQAFYSAAASALRSDSNVCQHVRVRIPPRQSIRNVGSSCHACSEEDIKRQWVRVQDMRAVYGEGHWARSCGDGQVLVRVPSKKGIPVFWPHDSGETQILSMWGLRVRPFVARDALAAPRSSFPWLFLALKSAGLGPP